MQQTCNMVQHAACDMLSITIFSLMPTQVACKDARARSNGLNHHRRIQARWQCCDTDGGVRFAPSSRAAAVCQSDGVDQPLVVSYWWWLLPQRIDKCREYRNVVHVAHMLHVACERSNYYAYISIQTSRLAIKVGALARAHIFAFTCWNSLALDTWMRSLWPNWHLRTQQYALQLQK